MKWNDNDIEYLKNNYSKIKNSDLEIYFNRTSKSISKKARSLGLKKGSFAWDEKELIELVKVSNSYTEVLRRKKRAVNGKSFKILKKYINTFKIKTDHFQTDIEKTKSAIAKNTFDLNDILIENSTYNNNANLKRRILKEGLLKYICVMCDNDGKWNGLELTLQLDHINGVRDDNRIENLRFLCPNCHSQTKTFAGRNNK